MGKGGIDNLVRSRVRELMEAHPYNPTRRGDGSWTQPYLIDDALYALWGGPSRLTDEQVGKLFTAEVHPHFKRTRAVLERNPDRAYTQDVFGAFARDIMAAYVGDDEMIMRLEAERCAVRDNLNTIADASA